MLASPSQTPEASSTSRRISRGHSCVSCQQRKVRCDRQKPCSNCAKAQVECVPSQPTLPRRRRRKLSEQDLTTKLRRYEYLLKKHGVKLEDDGSGSANPQGHHDDGCPGKVGSNGIMFADSQHSRYVENTLWERLRDEISEDPKEALQTSSDEEANEREIYPVAESFLIDHNSAPKDLSSLHPQPVHIFRLWQTYLVNCNPLVKFFHAPTMQQVILDASSNLHNVPRHTEALMFSIYLLAVTSLNNQECESMFNLSRSDLLTKYSHGTQQALVNARFLKSLSLSTLHAFCIYLLALRSVLDHHSMWILTGCAVRIAVRLGIQHDGTTHKIPPFEVEMRRRTWWQIVFLDGQASKLAGTGFPTWLGKFDTKLPLNLSDSDLSPTMKEMPPEKEGATEIMFCRLRAEVAGAYRKAGGLFGHGIRHINGTGIQSIAEKDKAIDELEARFQQHYIRYCDPSIPLHLLCMYMARSVICSMRLLAHHPRQYPDKGASMPQREKDMLWTESLKELEIAAACHLEKTAQGFLWHTNVQFPLDAFIYVLSELRNRTSGDLVERAWRQVEIVYQHRPEMISENKNTLYFAMGNLCLKAWAKHEEAGGRYQGTQLLPTPLYVSVLGTQRKIPDAPPPAPPVPPAPPQPQQPTPQTVFQQAQSGMSSNDTTEYTNYIPTGYSTYNTPTDQWRYNEPGFNMVMPEITPVDWAYWQTLMDGDLPTYNGVYTGDPGAAIEDSQGWIN